MSEGIRLVYVEDDERLGRLTVQYLTSQGVEVTLVTHGDHAVAEVVRVQPDVVLLDLMLPGTDGFEVCRELRVRTHVPIIMVTARLEEADRVRGLEGGADDYVTKPFQARELLARIRAQARRNRGESGPRQERLVVGDIAIDAATMEVTLRGAPLALTPNEYALLHALARNPNRVLGREHLLQLMHGTPDEAYDRSVDVIVSRLRHKIEDDVRTPKLLKTIRGAGYMLVARND